MIVEVYVASYRHPQRPVITEAATMVHVRFHRLVPRLHVGVVGYTPRPIDTVLNRILGQ